MKMSLETSTIQSCEELQADTALSLPLTPRKVYPLLCWLTSKTMQGKKCYWCSCNESNKRTRAFSVSVSRSSKILSSNSFWKAIRKLEGF